MLAAVITPPVILRVVVPGLDRWPAAVTVFTEPSASLTCEAWDPPTTCQSEHTKQPQRCYHTTRLAFALINDDLLGN